MTTTEADATNQHSTAPAGGGGDHAEPVATHRRSPWMLRVKAPEGYSTVGKVDGADADGVAELLIEASESVEEGAPTYEEVQQLMEAVANH